MAAPKVRMQISAGVGSGENKKLKIKSIFMNSSRKFRPVKKKKRKEKEDPASPRVKTGVTLSQSAVFKEHLLCASVARSTAGNRREEPCFWTSLVVQWLRIGLLTQETWVRSLLQEDFPCRGASKHHAPQLLKPVHPKPALCNERSQCTEKRAHNRSLQLDKA